MRKALDIMVLLFVLTTLAFGLIGCDGNVDQAKPEESEDVPQEPTSLDVFVIEGTTLKELTDYGETLGSIVLPDTITTLGEYAFENCTNLISIKIPSSITEIGKGAFQGCSGLINITIPDNVTKIGNWTFADCTSLTSVTIPDSVTVIGREAFYRCESLTSITIPSSVTEIGYEAFWGCSNLTDIYVNQSESTLLDNADVPDECTIHWNSTESGSV